MVLLDVSSKTALDGALEDQVLQVANVASVVRIEIILTLLISQLSERVHHNSEDNVQANNVDNDLESCVVYQFEQVLLSLVVEMYRFGNISDTTTITKSFIELSDEALEHGEAVVLSDDV